MDDEDLQARDDLLIGPLAARLSEWSTTTDFTLDAEQALSRPGAAIGVSWSDGPTSEAVAAGLAPDWVTHVPAHSGSGYPVTLERGHSRTMICAALLVLHDSGDLGAAVLAGQAALHDVVLSYLTPRELPLSLGRALTTRACLLEEIVPAGLSTDFAVGQWLAGRGRQILTKVLPTTLREPLRT